MALVGPLGRYLLPLAVVAVLIASFASCGADALDAAGDGTNLGQPTPEACATPNEGCPCPTAGATAECGHVKQQSGDYVACSMGTRTCNGGSWGPCVGSNIVTKTISPSFGGGGVGTQAVTQGPCPTTGPNANPCDPYCNQVIDDSGISIAPAATNCQYYEPADRSASYAAIATSHKANPGNPGPPASCTGGTTDNCGHDARCVGGTCQFYTAGQTGACVGSWDLTFATPCDNGGVDTLVVCNRGTVPANTGTVSGVMTAASLQGRSTTVSLYKSPVSSPRLGTCTIDLANTPIAAGTCRSIPMATACPGADLTSGTAPISRTIQWNMPDWTVTGDPARVAGECNTANNFTVWTRGSLLACQGVGCGSGSGVSLQTTGNGDSTCEPGPQLHATGTNVCTTANQYTVCQQDFRCVNPGTTSSQCVWNGGQGWFDPNVAGVDLTVGHPCTSPADVFPVCNRGSGTVPPGTPINIHVGGSSPLPNSCAPGPITCTMPAPSTGLGPGKCFNVTCNVAGNTYAAVSMTGVAEAPGLCANNQTYAKTNSSPNCASCTACDTRISGKVFDPSAGTPAVTYVNNLPLAGITVFQPSGALTPLTDGVACDTCAGVTSPSVTKAVTDATGSFTLSGVTPGPATRVVVQSGRWRREITVPVTACVNNTPADGTFRMPRSRTDGLGNVANIPKTAIATGNQESLECMLLRLGIAPTEIQRRVGSADAHRFQLYRATNGMRTSPVQPDISTLLNQATINEYSAVILDCDGGANQNGFSDNATAAQRTVLRNYVDLGGRLFVDHFSGYYALRSAEFPITATDTGGNVPSATPATGRVNVGTYPQQLFSDWLTTVGATFSPQWIQITEARRNFSTPRPGTVEWIAGRNNNGWGTGAPPSAPTNASDYTLSYSFETPFGGTCGGGGTGRTIYNNMHVSPGRCLNGSSGQACTGYFPTDCRLNTALNPEERALIYQFYQLTACQLGGEPPPPPPNAVAVTEITRDFEGTCPAGTAPVWQFWRWQSVTPPGTSVVFRAATADTQADLPAGPAAPAAPISVGAGTASGATVAAPNWASDANTIDWHLANDPAGRGGSSKRWLRIYMRFNPIGAVAPSLTGFRQDYSCVPAE